MTRGRSWIMGGGLALLLVGSAHADCVYGAQSKDYFTRLDDHTLVLQGGLGQPIVLKTYAFVLPYAQVTVLKDSFCSYEINVLQVDGQVWSVNQVNWLWR